MSEAGDFVRTYLVLGEYLASPNEEISFKLYMYILYSDLHAP